MVLLLTTVNPYTKKLTDLASVAVSDLISQAKKKEITLKLDLKSFYFDPVSLTTSFVSFLEKIIEEEHLELKQGFELKSLFFSLENKVYQSFFPDTSIDFFKKIFDTEYFSDKREKYTYLQYNSYATFSKFLLWGTKDESFRIISCYFCKNNDTNKEVLTIKKEEFFLIKKFLKEIPKTQGALNPQDTSKKSNLMKIILVGMGILLAIGFVSFFIYGTI